MVRESSRYPVDSFAVARENPLIPPLKPTLEKCRHPQVRVVARDEDAEFVECQMCGEIFDAMEYRDMVLEEEEAQKASEHQA